MAWETLVNTGLVTPSDFVRLTSTAAAKIFNIYPQKGAVQVGSDADLVIFDPAAEHMLGASAQISALDMSVYEGMRIRGKVSSDLLAPALSSLSATALSKQHLILPSAAHDCIQGSRARSHLDRWLQANSTSPELHCKAALTTDCLLAIEQVETTISRGRLAFHNNEVLVDRGSGRFVKLAPWAPAVFDGQQQRDATWIQVRLQT